MNLQTAVDNHNAPDNLSTYLDTLGRLEREVVPLFRPVNSQIKMDHGFI